MPGCHFTVRAEMVVGLGALSHPFSSAWPRTLQKKHVAVLGCWVELSYMFAHNYVLVLLVLYLFSQHNLMANVLFLEICVCTLTSLTKLFLIRDECS